MMHVDRRPFSRLRQHGVAAACVIILAGCAGSARPAPEPVRIYTEVEIPVTVPCPEGGPPDRPDFIDSAEAIRAVDPADLSVLLYSGRLQRDEHIARLEGMMGACGGYEAPAASSALSTR